MQVVQQSRLRKVCVRQNQGLLSGWAQLYRPVLPTLCQGGELHQYCHPRKQTGFRAGFDSLLGMGQKDKQGEDEL